MNMIDLINATINGDKEAAKQAFDTVINSKVNDTLEIKKIEIASSLISPMEQTTVEIETDDNKELEKETSGNSIE